MSILAIGLVATALRSDGNVLEMFQITAKELIPLRIMYGIKQPVETPLFKTAIATLLFCVSERHVLNAMSYSNFKDNRASEVVNQEPNHSLYTEFPNRNRSGFLPNCGGIRTFRDKVRNRRALLLRSSAAVPFISDYKFGRRRKSLSLWYLN